MASISSTPDQVTEQSDRLPPPRKGGLALASVSPVQTWTVKNHLEPSLLFQTPLAQTALEALPTGACYHSCSEARLAGGTHGSLQEMSRLGAPLLPLPQARATQPSGGTCPWGCWRDPQKLNLSHSSREGSPHPAEPPPEPRDDPEAPTSVPTQAPCPSVHRLLPQTPARQHSLGCWSVRGKGPWVMGPDRDVRAREVGARGARGFPTHAERVLPTVASSRMAGGNQKFTEKPNVLP